MIQERSAGAVVYFRSGKDILYLLLRHTTDYWNFPKGNLEKGETDELAAKREILEETGLTVDFTAGFREEVHWFYTRDAGKVSKTVVFYIAEAHTHDVVL